MLLIQTPDRTPAMSADTMTTGMRPRYPRLLLASRSPRRRWLLSEAGIEHEACHPGFDDSALVPTGVTAAEWVTALAHLKAAAGVELARGEDMPRLVLGADTTCVQGTEFLGTPATPEEAERMLRGFVGAEHEVVTGVALIDAVTGRRWLFADSAMVRWGEVSEEQIRAYVASGEWQGKAGAYNLRERLAAGWKIEFDGDPTTIMGLPMRVLARELPRIQAELEVA
jgi:septum formation protein